MQRPAYRREPREADLPEAPVEPMPPALLSEALERLAAIPEPVPQPPEVVKREVTIAMQIAALRSAMGRAGQVVLQRVLAGCQSRTEVAVTVLALLELVRRRQATVQQDELFGPIVVRPIAGSAG
jgi:segregation and condensation protein A